MGWLPPSFSKKAVRQAGDNIRHHKYGPDDLKVMDDWRAAHGYIINTFQANLRQRTRNTKIIVGQRLKRASTIVDKLTQGRSLDLSTMHDIAGIRLIFDEIPSLREFRSKFHLSRAKHVLVNATEKYDYIASPKASGYRGIHDVYKYQTESKGGASWNGLLIELQYRTLVQHAWATAVELSDVLTANRTKFNQGAEGNERFFKICSELLARKYENSVSCLPNLSHAELVTEWHKTEASQQIFETLRTAGRQGDDDDLLSGFALLIIPEKQNLKIETFTSYRSALKALLEYESAHPTWDVVLVGGDSLNNTFRNYFRNAAEFIQLINEALR